MNLSIISILMLFAFGSIYLMTYQNIYNSINQELHRILDNKRDFPPKEMIDGLIDPVTIKNKDLPFDKQVISDNFPDRFVYFVIETDLSGNIVSQVSFFDAEDTFYAEALAIVTKSNEETGQFHLDHNKWAYMVAQREDKIVYAFLDMSTQQNVLDRLMYTFLLVTLSTLIFILLISTFLTNRSIAPIKEAFYKQKQFISDASHELKTPLAVIQTNVDVLISNQTSKDSPDLKWLTYIKSEIGRMSNLTRDLLYLTQMESAEEAPLFHHAFDLSEKVEQQLLGMEVVAYEKNITLDYEIEPGVTLNGNPEQMTQVVMILLDNALKYTPEKGQIHLKLKKSPHHIHLVVSNTGAGIQPEDLSKIFDRFYRVDKSRSRSSGSHGLGLSIAKAIVEGHNGKIICESQPQQLTSFIVKIRI